MFATELGTAESFCKRHPEICAMLYREMVAGGGDPPIPPEEKGGDHWFGGGHGDIIQDPELKDGSHWYGGGHGIIDRGGPRPGGTVIAPSETGQLDYTNNDNERSPSRGGPSYDEYNQEQSDAVQRAMMELSKEERAEIIRQFVRGRALNRAGTAPTVAIAHGGAILAPPR